MGAVEKHSILTITILLAYLNTVITNTGSTLSNSVFEEDNFRPHILNQRLENDIKRTINTTADPCKDFYAYSCGNYNGYPASDDDSVREITEYLNHKFNRKLMKLLHSKTDLRNLVSKSLNFIRFDRMKQTFQEKTRYYYEACVRENRMNFAKYFEELHINWALLPEECEICWGSRLNHFWQTLGQLQQYNWNNLIIKHEITASKDDALNIILESEFNIGQPNLPEDNAIEGILKALKVDNASEVVQQLKATEEKWLEILQNNTSSEFTNTTELSLIDLTVEYPFLRSYLRKLLGQNIHRIDKIVLKNVSFFKYLHGIEWTTDELHQQLNYLMVIFMFYLFEDSSSNFTHNACIIDLRNKFDLAVNYIYYEEIYSKDHWLYEDGFRRLNHQMEVIIQDIFEENHLNLTIRQVKDLKDKMRRIQINLGNLPYPVLSQTIEKFYEELPDLDKGNYFKNHLLLLQHRFQKSLLCPDDLIFFITSDNSMGSSSSMFYVHKQNLLVVPFASLQYPLYHYIFKPLYQVSLMGFLIAHEIGHAFDKNELIATGHSGIVEHVLHKKAFECMQNQEPTDDIEERIADLLGERVAYRTYESFYNAANNTNWQREFYLSMAQFFCNKGNVTFIDHDPSDVRLHQIVMNSEGFAKVFNCPVDSPMNPREKCRLY